MKTLRPLLLVLAVSMTGGVVHGAPAAGSPCRDACYEAKSVAYQRCRSISPANRAARRACFRKADAELQRCLKACR
jgi:hypothetical protein